MLAINYLLKHLHIQVYDILFSLMIKKRLYVEK